MRVPTYFPSEQCSTRWPRAHCPSEVTHRRSSFKRFWIALPLLLSVSILTFRPNWKTSSTRLWRRIGTCDTRAQCSDLLRLKRDTDTGRAVATRSGSVAVAQDAAPQSGAQQGVPTSGSVPAVTPPFSAAVKVAELRTAAGRKVWKIVVPAAVLVIVLGSLLVLLFAFNVGGWRERLLGGVNPTHVPAFDGFTLGKSFP